jgi:hypothetical protein
MSEPESTVKQVQIAGARPKDLLVKRRRRTRRQEGGDDDDASPSITKMDMMPAATVAKINTVPLKGGHTTPQTHVPTVPPPSAPVRNNIPPAPAITGGAQDTKVILKSKVKRTAKVLLKKKEVPGPAAPAPAINKSLKVKTRKVILKSLDKRLKKTRHAVKHAQQLPIQQVRAVLVDKGLIKATSKAPESVLRQIYSDSLIVAKKTL